MHARAMEQLAAGDWDGAHETIQAGEDTLACLIHGHLHRIEGDLANARYWYRRAGEELPDHTIEEESDRLAGMAVAAD